ncbi:MAG: stage V sporulation protein AD [Clostridia bacterium]|nr:stage V sporulation protein AD [Clostridia bacterium]
MGHIWEFEAPARVLSHASAVGREEFLGPLGSLFDYHDESDRFGAKTWEKAEGALGATVFNLALGRAGLSHTAIDLLLAGDLQNQCVASSGGLSVFGVPYLGLYGACSTFVEGLLVSALALNAAQPLSRVAVVTTSHNCAAERQFRLPLEYGGQRTPTAQWTATAGGCLLLERGRQGVCLTAGMAGRMVDGGVSDAANMGAAMAPAAADSLVRWFRESGESPTDYDAIITGDLGQEGSEILSDLLAMKGLSLSDRHRDCGVLLYDRARQDVHAGGSGCGCCASVTAALFLPQLLRGEMRRVLLMATGALMSPTSVQQGGSIVGIAPIVRMEVLEK